MSALLEELYVAEKAIAALLEAVSYTHLPKVLGGGPRAMAVVAREDMGATLKDTLKREGVLPIE